MFQKISKVVVLFAIITFPICANAQQQTSRPDRGVSAGNGTQQSSEIDSINLQNGSLAVQIPLASLPAMAGGKLGYTLTAFYNSKLWNVYREEKLAEPYDGSGCRPVYTTETVVKSEDSGAGWRIGGKYEVFFRNGDEEFRYVPPDGAGCYGPAESPSFISGGLIKPMLRTPDGGEHELKIDGWYQQYQGSREFLANYWQTMPGQPLPITQPMRLYTIDGTFLSVVLNPPSSSSVYWTIYTKDGTRIESSTDGQRHIDTNGNSILFGSNATDGEFAMDEYTGRKIKWKRETVQGVDRTRVQYQSTGGAWQNVDVVWGTTTVTGKVYRKTGWKVMYGENGELGAPCSHHQPLTETLEVVRKIAFPSTEASVTSRDYVFEYNSDTTEQRTLADPRWDCTDTEYDDDVRPASIGWGELSKITTPTDSKISYGYSNDGTHVTSNVSDSADEVARSIVTSKSIEHDGTTDTWHYGGGTTVTNPDGSTYTEYAYDGYNISMPSYRGGSDTAGLSGLVYRTISSQGVMTEKRWITLGGTAIPYGSNSAKSGVNAVVDTEFTTLLASDGVTRLKMSAKKFQYDYNGELLKTIEYDWFPNLNDVTYDSGIPNLPSAVPSNAEILRVTANSYYNSASTASDPTAYHKRTVGTSAVILGKVKETTVGPTTSSIKSHTKFSYDGQPFDTAPTKGNLTEVSAYNSAGTGSDAWLETVTTYTPRGNVETVTDPKLNVTQISYGSVDGVSTLTDLYPTQTTQAAGTSVATTSAVKYDFGTGLPILSTDVDNSVSVETVYDILGRPIIVKNAVNTPLESWTETEYSDSNRRVITRSDIESLHDKRKVSTQFFDQLGRVRLAKTLEDSATQSAENETDGIKVETRYKVSSTCTFNASKTCSYQITSNPFRAATSGAATGEQTMGWTMSQTVNDGRYSEVQTFSGPGLPAAFGGTNTTPTGIVKTTIDANTTTVEDQAGKLRRSITNPLGQLTRVDEPSSAGLGTVDTPNQPTVYTYDVLNNLLTVTQNGSGVEQCGPSGGSCFQTRTFTYSSLSRLISASNPESGIINYSYDPNGNLTAKIDARGVKTDYVYNQLNRVTNRNYSLTGPTPSNYQASPNVTYTYGTAAPAIGKLTKVSTGDGDNLSTTEYVEFDILGRVKRSIQKTDNVTYGGGTDPNYWMTYTYNLSGALIEQQYPSGRKVKNILDADGELATVQSKKNPSHAYWNYANHFSYNAAGAVTSMQLGNGRWESTKFNERLQPTQIALGKTAPVVNGQQVTYASELLKLEYQYGDLQWDGSVPTGTNNGNVAKQTITVQSVGSTPGFTAVQNYDYDALNRIQIASETLTPTTGTPESWVQEFKYDRFGNRKFNEQTTTTLPKECGTEPNLTVCPDDPKINPSANPNNNKLIGYTFDASGNTKLDAQNRKFYYDGENKQTKVITVNASEVETAKVGEYWYDGDGRRIKKRAYEENVPTEETIFVYDAFGKLIGEHSNQAASAEHAKVAYLTNDHLGSPRINTDAGGNVLARHDYHPFGEEIATSYRASGLRYSGDAVRKQFTGYERDDECSLDFAQARYYNNQHGRFTSPDPLPGERGIPQSLNRYVYVGNRPLVFVDPEGLEWVNKDGRPAWVKPDEYAIQTADGTALPLWDQNRMKYESGEGIVTLDPRGPNPETPWGWTLDSIAVGDPNEPALDPSVPGENREESTATDTPPMVMSSSGDPRRNWYFIYEDARARRSRGQALFPDSRGLDAERHRWATRQTALRWGGGTARTLGVLNEFQGFIFHDLFALPSTFEGRRNWAFQLSDLQNNERGIDEADAIMSQSQNHVPK